MNRSIKKSAFGIIILSAIVALGFINVNKELVVSPEESVATILERLGEPSNHTLDKDIEKVSAEVGRQIIHNGFAEKPGGGKTKKQSKHFVCTSCHNTEREDPDLAVVDPEARLLYTAEKGIPFLQGSPLFGVVNREQFYNDDYYKKYGDVVLEARTDIRKSIQLCATECAQGRALKDWEIESILAYLWTIDLKLSDLNLSQENYNEIEKAIQNNEQNTELVELIKSKYVQNSPAHFIPPPEDRKTGTPDIVGNPENGRLIYDNSCLHCHENRRYSFFHLDDEKITLKYLSKKAPKYSRHSIYQVGRYGQDSKSGKRSYMPKYPEEKMSLQQLEDLRAYLDSAS
jgi:mono/diheme cytochrome c family protein